MVPQAINNGFTVYATGLTAVFFFRLLQLNDHIYTQVSSSD